jgi:hypothetical protein
MLPGKSQATILTALFVNVGKWKQIQEVEMLERHETFLGEQMRRQNERRYAQTHRLARQAGLPVSFYRKMICNTLIHFGTQMVRLGRKLQGPSECGASPILARAK